MVVACGLLALVLVLSLAAFFGVRAWLGDGEPAGAAQSSVLQGVAVLAGQGAEAA